MSLRFVMAGCRMIVQKRCQRGNASWWEVAGKTSFMKVRFVSLLFVKSMHRTLRLWMAAYNQKLL